MGLRLARLIITAALGVSCISQLLFAEAEGTFTANATCGTQTLWMAKQGKSLQDVQACSNEGMCDVPSNRDAKIPNGSTPITYVRMAIHILRNDDGSSPISSDANTQTIINNLQADYLPSRIQFEPVVIYDNSTQWRNLSEGEIAAMKSATAYKPDSFLNVWATQVDFGYSYGTFPWDPQALTDQGGIIMGHFHWTVSSHVFAHEVGHCLGLYHTFNGVDEVSACGPCYEGVGFGDNDVRGDRCADTDPGPTINGCAMTGTDACTGLSWGAALSNLHSYMSYSSCIEYFTTQQKGRMQCWTQNALSSLISNVRIDVTNQIGHVPLAVDFNGLTAKSVNSWNWDFGDGGSSTIQQPSHVYTTPGMYDVSVTIHTNEGNFTTVAAPCVAAQADTVKVVSTSGAAGDTAFVNISCRNYIPLTEFKIPFHWDGPFGLALVDVRTTGLRTDYMGFKQFTSFDPGNNRAAFKISAGSQAPLPPGNGPIMTLVFIIPSGASGSPNPITIQSYGTQNTRFFCTIGDYEPSSVDGTLGTALCGDINNNGTGPNIQDLTYLVNFLFAGGPAPQAMAAANINGVGGVNIQDLVYLVGYLFGGGLPPDCF